MTRHGIPRTESPHKGTYNRSRRLKQLCNHSTRDEEGWYTPSSCGRNRCHRITTLRMWVGCLDTLGDALCSLAWWGSVCVQSCWCTVPQMVSLYSLSFNAHERVKSGIGRKWWTKLPSVSSRLLPHDGQEITLKYIALLCAGRIFSSKLKLGAANAANFAFNHSAGVLT